MRFILTFLLALILLCFLCIGLYFVPPIHQQLSWRVDSLGTQLYYALYPPDQVALAPSDQVRAAVDATVQAMFPPAAVTPALQSIPITVVDTPALPIAPTAPPQSTAPLPTPTIRPLPFQISLAGIRHEYQTFNNCGPANTSMLLSYWGWQGDQQITRAALRPHPDDANVMPQEIAAYAAQANMRAYIRVGGSIAQLRALLAAGFPVLVEMGHHPDDDWWMGHYVVISGYDDLRQVLILHDSLEEPDLLLPYAEMEQHWWRDFNRVFIVFAPPERELELLALLGPDADLAANLRRALAETEAEIPHLGGRDLFFALYNQGADFLALGRTQDAVNAFDLAFSVYAGLEKDDRPWRVLWYRTDAYAAYYAAGRYQSVEDLSRATLSMLSKRGLEESHYWRGMAFAAMGDTETARAELKLAIKLRSTYGEAIQALANLPQ